MIKNAKSLMANCRNVANKNNITINEVLQIYMFERVIERISISNYKNNFILKGGLLLSSIIGIHNRTTMDMDAALKGYDISINCLKRIINELLSLDIGDGVSFVVRDIDPIRIEEDEYGGLKFNLIAKYENIKVDLSIDIAECDVITPREIKYEYKKLFEDSYISIMSYNTETILAEKFHTLISRLDKNSRMKDYYDLYFLLKAGNYNENVLKQAIKNTFSSRNTGLDDLYGKLKNIEVSSYIRERFENYKSKHTFSKDVNFDEVIILIKEKIVQLLEA